MALPTLSQIQEVLRTGRSGPRLSQRQVARRLFCSESTLRCRLRENGTTFARERNEVRAEVAFELLLRGSPASQVARRLGVTPDHLRVIVKQAYRGYTPRKIALIARVARRLEHEPTSVREFEAAQRDDLLLQGLVADIGSGHPLYRWAMELVLLGFDPERETAKYRNELRKRERAAFEKRRQRVEAEVVMSLPLEELHEIDYSSLLEDKHHSRQHMLYAVKKRREREAQSRLSASMKAAP